MKIEQEKVKKNERHQRISMRSKESCTDFVHHLTFTARDSSFLESLQNECKREHILIRLEGELSVEVAIQSSFPRLLYSILLTTCLDLSFFSFFG